ncbi:MAG: hypothetical protein SFU56_00735 [Capsulimonadales bacterium]|nr:hypothetical protein [Capsulimonadales bacterium]
MVARDTASVTRKVGPFDVSAGQDELVLRMPKQGELSFLGCMMFGSTMLAVLIIGVMSVLQNQGSTVRGIGVEQPSILFSLRENHFGFLWLFGSALILFLLPLYVLRAYNADLVFRFRRSDDSFFRGSRRVTRLRRIEFVTIRETKDPDKRYLYLLSLVYNDGQQMLIHNGYDERATMNLANEISVFVGCPVKWKQGRAGVI